MTWQVNVKGCWDDHFEITLVCAGDEHSKKSWGWYGERKRVISYHGSPYSKGSGMSPEVFGELLLVAKRECDRLNGLEK